MKIVEYSDKIKVVFREMYVYKGGGNMKFVKADDLKRGMRLARPIYNKNGVLLYDRDTRLTVQGIASIKNFNLIGIYVLEDTEPVPPMTHEDIEFERFQTMSVFSLREDIELMNKGKEPANLDTLVNMIYMAYAKPNKKVSTIQNLRSNEDFMYKHCLFKAILGAAMAVRLKLSEREIREVIMAGLIACMGYTEVVKIEHIPENVKLILQYEQKLLKEDNFSDPDRRKINQAKVLVTAGAYDDMTAMHIGREPSSEVVAVKYLIANTDKYGDNIVGALVDSMRMLYPGICVELTNKKTGIVILQNEDNVLRPLILGFHYNEMYNLMADDVYEKVQIKDIMKSMDRRVKIDHDTIRAYMDKYSKKAF